MHGLSSPRSPQYMCVCVWLMCLPLTDKASRPAKGFQWVWHLREQWDMKLHPTADGEQETGRDSDNRGVATDHGSKKGHHNRCLINSTILYCNKWIWIFLWLRPEIKCWAIVSHLGSFVLFRRPFSVSWGLCFVFAFWHKEEEWGGIQIL